MAVSRGQIQFLGQLIMEDYSPGVHGGFGNCFSVETLINMRRVLHYFQVKSSERVWQKKSLVKFVLMCVWCNPYFRMWNSPIKNDFKSAASRTQLNCCQLFSSLFDKLDNQGQTLWGERQLRVTLSHCVVWLLRVWMETCLWWQQNQPLSGGRQQHQGKEVTICIKPWCVFTEHSFCSQYKKVEEWSEYLCFLTRKRTLWDQNLQKQLRRNTRWTWANFYD